MSFGLQSEENEQCHMIARDAIQVRFGHYHLIATLLQPRWRVLPPAHQRYTTSLFDSTVLCKIQLYFSGLLHVLSQLSYDPEWYCDTRKPYPLFLTNDFDGAGWQATVRLIWKRIYFVMSIWWVWSSLLRRILTSSFLIIPTLRLRTAVRHHRTSSSAWPVSKDIIAREFTPSSTQAFWSCDLHIRWARRLDGHLPRELSKSQLIYFEHRSCHYG